MPYNAPNTKNVYKGGKLPPLLVVTSEKIVMKDELEVYIKIQKNLPNYSIMESADPFTRDFHPLDNARAEHTKRKSPVNLAIYRTLLRRERDSNPRYLAVRRFSRPVHSTTLPSLLRCCIAVLTGAKIRSVFDMAKRFGDFFCREGDFLGF